MSLPDLAFASAAEAGRAIARREVSPTELARAVLERIERHDAALAAHVTVSGDRALAEAARAEAEIAAGHIRGPLHGVPIGLKDLFDTADLRTTAGSKILAAHVPDRDAAIVERLREAGTVLVGKHNLHEFAYGTTSDNPHYGPCRNPWDLSRVAGGSSGGSAAALAAGLCFLAPGTDTGGSIRIPASACGVVGLKPTFGRVSRRGVFPLAWSLDHVGPLARTVEDAALALEVMAGADDADPWCARQPSEPFARDLERGVDGLVLGLPRPLFFDSLEPDVAAAFENARLALERAGATFVDVEIPSLRDSYTAFHAILASEASARHEPWLRERPHDYGEGTRNALLQGFAIPAVDYVNARRFQGRLSAELDAALGRVTALLTPTLPRTAPPLGEPVSREPASAWNRLLVPFNLAGLPALSVPCGFDRQELPIGLQIVGRAFDEATVLRVGRAWEREWDGVGAMPGAASGARRPPGF